VNVLASPHILSLDNKEAKIEVGDEVPVATSVTQAGVDSTVIGNTTSQVQFKSVGTILTVTPHINEKKQVTMKVSQEVSEVGDPVFIGGQAYTGFKTRKANTTAIVQDGHTLIIGGIIQEGTKMERSGLPFLSQIPVLGYLFGTTKDTVVKRELILLITPHVVGDKEEADQLTEEYKNRIKDVRRKIDDRQKKLGQADIHMHKHDEGGEPE
jgi:general secretion pathway protein D